MPAKIILNDKQKDEIRVDYYNGMTIRSLCNKYSISPPTINIYLKSLGLIRLGRIAQKDVDFVLANSKLCLKDLIKLTKLDRATILKILDANDKSADKKIVIKPVKVRKLSKFEQLYIDFTKEFIVDDISKLLSRSMNYAEKETGYSACIIKKYAIEHNICINKFFRTIGDISEDDKNTIREYYSSDMYTMREIMEMFRIGSKILRKIIDGIVLPIKVEDKELVAYQKLVRRLSTVVKNFYNMGPPPGHHIDHKLSVIEGYHQKISAYLIASYENLQVITILENLKKGSSSTITKDELYKSHGLI